MNTTPHAGAGAVAEARLLIMAGDLAAELARQVPADSPGWAALTDLAEALAGGRHVTDLVDDWALPDMAWTAAHLDEVHSAAADHNINNNGGGTRT